MSKETKSSLENDETNTLLVKTLESVNKLEKNLQKLSEEDFLMNGDVEERLAWQELIDELPSLKEGILNVLGPK